MKSWISYFHSQELEDTVFESSPTMKFDDIQKGSRSSVDADISANLTREVTPESPLSQVCPQVTPHICHCGRTIIQIFLYFFFSFVLILSFLP
jgi:hypothetical protein